MTMHYCLARPEAGDSTEGDAPDCPDCREALLGAFRAPAEAPPPPPETPPWNGQHVTHSVTRPYDDHPGGLWEAVCTCGWSKAGPYARDGMGQTAAARLARLHADRHRANPLADDPEARPHLMAGPEHTRTVEINPVHTARYVALNDPGHPTTGMWEASCSCGWQTGGRWGGAMDLIRDVTHARLKAQAEAEAHLTKENP